MASTDKRYGIPRASIKGSSGNVTTSLRKRVQDVKTPTLNVETIQMMFLNAYNTLMEDRSQIIEDCEMMSKALVDFAQLDSEIARQSEEVEGIAERVRGLVGENATSAQSQKEYIKKYESLSERYDTEFKKLENLQKDKELRKSREKAMEVFIKNLKDKPLIVDKWDESLWSLMVEKAEVGRDGSIKFIFYNGTEITAMCSVMINI